jgi:hypothetical protein
MIRFLIFKRYNFIDFVCQAVMIYGLIKYNDWKWVLIVFPFGILNLFLESVERVNNGGKK